MHKAKKSLGQNFLKSEAALKKIIEAGEIKPENIILEIGPGKGALTKKLLEKAGYVIAVEKDHELFELLQNKFEKEIKEKKLILIEDDILKFDISGFLKNETSLNFLTPRVPLGTPRRTQEEKIERGFVNNNRGIFYKNYKVVANIPYNITGAILKKFLEEKTQPEMMVLMVQNEVAKRIVGNRINPTSLKLRGAKESILSISVKAYGTPKIEMKVPARYFSPAPKVDSAIISIKDISRDFFIENKINENDFWQIIHAGFAHKRKKLSSNLKKIQNITKKDSVNELKNKRAEELSLKDWVSLVKDLNINTKE